MTLTSLPLPIQLITASIQTVNVLRFQVITPWHYLLLQSQIITRYLQLVVWPSPLLITYTDWPIPESLIEVWPWMMGIGLLFVIAIYGVVRNKPWGMLGVWFFLILAPTSSFLPIVSEPGGERRMYLPAIGVVLAITLLGERLVGLLSRRPGVPIAATGVIVLILTQVTLWRNEDFATPLQMWSDMVIKRPLNADAQNNLGTELLNRSQWKMALDRFDATLLIRPNFGQARSNRGMALIFLGDPVNGIAEQKEGVRLDPTNPATWAFLGWGCQLVDQPQTGELYLRKALEFDPNNMTALYQLSHPADPVAHVSPEVVQPFEVKR